MRTLCSLRSLCKPRIHPPHHPYCGPLASFLKQPMKSTAALPFLLVPGRRPFLCQLHFSMAVWSEQPIAFKQSILARPPEVMADPFAHPPKGTGGSHQYLPDVQVSQHCQCCPLALRLLLFCRLPGQRCHRPACTTCIRRLSRM